MNKSKIIICDIINPVSDTQAELIRNGAAVLVRRDSDIIDKPEYIFEEKGSAGFILEKYENTEGNEIIDRSGELMLPAFFDIHFHWVQDDVRQMPKENLLNWLSEFVWPYEANFSNPDYSKRKALSFAEKIASAGTVGGACYGSIHSHTVDHAVEFFKGNFTAGNVLMTMNSPEYLIQTEEEAVSSVKTLSARYGEKYAATPRFAPTTAPDVMRKCAEYAAHNNSFIQTHLSETEKEIDFVLSLYRTLKGFEKVKTYTEIYNSCGILGPKTIMGHCIHLSEEELYILGSTNTAIAHCPSSNAPVADSGLGSGLFNFRKAEINEIRWALASDIGGGPFLSMFDVMRSFVQQNRKKNIDDATYIKALYRSTASGAEIMGLGKTNGTIDQNKNADFILIESPVQKENETAEDVLKTVVESRAENRDKYIEIINSTFLRGEEIYSKRQGNIS